MIKRLRVTVDGKAYDVTVEVPEEAASPAAPAITPPPAVAPAPTSVATAPAPAPAAASPAPTPTSAAKASGAGDVPSPLSGRVTAVVATVGQDVKEGDHLLTLEAMKMNTFVFAPKSGKVSAVLTEVGAIAEEGQVLVRIG